MLIVWIALIIVHITLAITGLIAYVRFCKSVEERLDYVGLALICVMPALYWTLVYVFRNGFGGWI